MLRCLFRSLFYLIIIVGLPILILTFVLWWLENKEKYQKPASKEPELEPIEVPEASVVPVETEASEEEEAPPAKEIAPVVEIAPTREIASMEEIPPTEKVAVTEEMTPPEEIIPTEEEITPVEETPPAEATVTIESVPEAAPPVKSPPQIQIPEPAPETPPESEIQVEETFSMTAADMAETPEPAPESQEEAATLPGEEVPDTGPLEPDELKRIEGIGPKVSSLLNDAGILTFAQLAATPQERLRRILDEANLRFLNPATWPEQAALAAAKNWEGLAKLQEALKGGQRVD
ncbi:MAG: hypothetical protein JXA33_02330 [Anaerolineae bacterium]|nr:hypothetical protein [Anaerolineae bacterium]